MSSSIEGAEGADFRTPDGGGAPAAPTRGARSSILRASAVMASGTMVSRILGFVRSAMLLAAIGAAGGGVSAAFQTANTLPNTVFNLLASGVFDAVLVPQIVGALKREHDGETYVNRLLTLAGTLLFLVTVVSMIAAPLLVVITAAGYDSQIRSLAILFAFLCLPQLFFYGLYNLLGELLNARGVFGPYMWAPVVNNVVGIAGLAAFLGIWGGTEGRLDVADFSSAQFWVLGGSATLGVVAQALCLLLPMRRARVSFRPDFRFRGTHFGSTSKVAAWTFATLGVSQVGVLSTNNLAALADAYAKSHEVIISGINAYATAFMIFMVPQSLITVSLTTAIFTRMAEAVSDGDDEGVAANYTLGVRTITSLTLLAAAILIAGAMPMMQMALPTYADQQIVEGYAWVLAALMPGVASTGMVLMSQRVFFAYEDAKPVFLMGIGPTIVQVLVGWSMYFLTGSQWWVVGAALGETACRLVQGVIAVIWVARRNSFVDRGAILRSYSVFLASAVVAGAVGFVVLRLVGVETIASSAASRFGIATAKMLLVSLVASFAYMLALRLVGPVESARTIAPILARFRVPAPLRALLAAPRTANGGEKTIMTDENRIDTGGPMDEDARREDEDLSVSRNAPAAEEHDPDDALRSPEALEGAEADSGSALPNFEEVLRAGDEEAEEHDPDDVSAPDEKPGARVAVAAALSGWASRLSSALRSAADPEEDRASGGPAADAAASKPSSLPEDEDSSAPSDLPPAPEEDLPPLPGVDGLPATKPGSGAGPDEAVVLEERRGTGIPAPLVPLGGAVPGATPFEEVVRSPEQEPFPHPVETPGSDREASPKEPARDREGRRLIDPTTPTLVFAAALTLIGAVWAVTTARAPVTDFDIAQSLSAAQQSAQSSGDRSGDAPAEAAPASAAPKVSSASVLSWSNDDGDHPDAAVNMIDGDPNTTWHSRWYEMNQFADDSNVTIVLKLEQATTVSSISIAMDPSTSGGALVVRDVTDPANPRGGTELASTALSPSTEIALPQPVTTSSIALSFREMPTSVEGRTWAWISEIVVK